MTEEEVQRRIRDLAHGLWQSGGRRGRRGLDDWLIAEQMIRELRTKAGEPAADKELRAGSSD
jgi:hypothetical protein